MGIGGVAFDLLCWLMWTALYQCYRQQDYKSAKKFLQMAFTYYYKPNIREELETENFGVETDFTALGQQEQDGKEKEEEKEKEKEEDGAYNKEDFFRQYLPEEEPKQEQEAERRKEKGKESEPEQTRSGETEEEKVSGKAAYYLYNLLKEAPIWNDPEFWSVAFYGTSLPALPLSSLPQHNSSFPSSLSVFSRQRKYFLHARGWTC